MPEQSWQECSSQAYDCSTAEKQSLNPQPLSLAWQWFCHKGTLLLQLLRARSSLTWWGHQKFHTLDHMYKITGMLYREVLIAAKTLNCCVSSHEFDNLTSGSDLLSWWHLTHTSSQAREAITKHMRSVYFILTWNIIDTWVKWRANLRLLQTSITLLKLNCQLSSHIHIAQNHKVIHSPPMASLYHYLYTPVQLKMYFRKIKTGKMEKWWKNIWMATVEGFAKGKFSTDSWPPHTPPPPPPRFYLVDVCEFAIFHMPSWLFF